MYCQAKARAEFVMAKPRHSFLALLIIPYHKLLTQCTGSSKSVKQTYSFYTPLFQNWKLFLQELKWGLQEIPNLFGGHILMKSLHAEAWLHNSRQFYLLSVFELHSILATPMASSQQGYPEVQADFKLQAKVSTPYLMHSNDLACKLMSKSVYLRFVNESIRNIKQVRLSWNTFMCISMHVLFPKTIFKWYTKIDLRREQSRGIMWMITPLVCFT